MKAVLHMTYLDDDATIMNDIRPLLALRVARFRIDFTAENGWDDISLLPKIRSKLGYHLKMMNCLEKNFRKTECGGCGRSSQCLYPALFSPLRSATEKGRQGQGATPARPFVISVDFIQAPANGYQKGFVTITLFGIAVERAKTFLSAAVPGLESMGFKCCGISWCMPGRSFLSGPCDDNAPHCFLLADWVESMMDAAFSVPFRFPKQELVFITPVLLTVSENGGGAEGIRFQDIVKTLLRRLRDLKRAYGEGSDMGSVTEDMFRMAESVITKENSLSFEKRSRYSHNKKRNIPLEGVNGRVSFDGPYLPFLPLLFAGEIIHIGKNTTNGYGRMAVAI